jgi:uncharacterized protein
MHYILFYDVVPDYLTRRVPLRDQHLGLLRQAHERGELLMAGALADPADGAVLIFRGPSPAPAEAFAKADPYVLNGLVTGWRVRKWNNVIGDNASI